MVDQRCPTALQRLGRDGLIVQRAFLPAPREEAAPFACEGPHGGLLGLAVVAVLLVVHRCPAGLPARLCSPGDARVPEALGPWEAPGPPGLRAAPCGPRRAPGIVLPC